MSDGLISNLGNNTQAQNTLHINQGIKDFAVGAVTVTGTQIELKAGAIAMHQRWQLIVYPPDAGTIYWGKSGVTSATGAPLNAGDAPLTFDMYPDTMVPIYAVSDGTDHTVRVVESK
jgi:hypothetical protein